MSHEPAEEKPVTIRASKGGGGAWKWIAGAAAAAVLAGGGYYAWQNYGATPSNTNVASNDTQQFAQTSEPPIQAGPLPAQQANNNVASPDESGSSSRSSSGTNTTAGPSRSGTSSSGTQTAAATSSRRHTVQQTPQETIGVMPASMTTQESEPIIVEGARRPVWTRTPAAWRLAETYPTRALEQGREGEASLRCTVLSNGALDCAPVSEYPARSGFGGAALRVAHMFRHAQTLKDGRDAVGSPVNLRVVFRVDDNTRRG